MTCLPLEILTAIVKEVDGVHDLCNVRIVCRAFCATATPIAFRVLYVIPTKGSAKNLGQLLDVPDIAVHVREVAYRDTGADRKGRMLNHIRANAICELANSFSRVHQLPRLETINLTFYPLYDNRLGSDGQGRLAVQASILHVLATSFGVRAPKLTSLSLDNLRIWEFPPPRISFIPDRPDDPAPPRAVRASWFNICWVHFWGTLCPHMILAPTQQTLTELTLHSDAPVGASSGLSLSALHFPLLCVFSVRGLVFELSIEVEPFVLRHAATLTQLEVLACKLPALANLPLSCSRISTALARDEGLSSGPGGWDWIWGCFAAELTALVTLDVDTECRYIEPTPFWGVPVPELRYAADAAALQRFHRTVAARSRETREES
ncbi:hypothetical protein EDB85DRAFT_2196544 [Lactarius pseudohatsudake]|nr:hypothetical protein EDB85DRAFT_2196544 [Lactarius pseudohatsudake]